MDEEDLVTSLFHVVDPSNGGETKYYTGLTSNSFGHLPKEISCEHGWLTIGWFDKILHCGESWSSICGYINFNLKIKSWNISWDIGINTTSSLKVMTFLQDHFFHVSNDHDWRINH